MTDTFDYTCMQSWLIDELEKRGITRPSQILGRTEEELSDSKVLIDGAILNLSWYFEKRGQFFRRGENSLSRLHLHMPGVRMLRDQGIYDLDDLEECTWSEIAWDFGFGRERASFIETMMKRNGRNLRG